MSASPLPGFGHPYPSSLAYARLHYGAEGDAENRDHCDDDGVHLKAAEVRLDILVKVPQEEGQGQGGCDTDEGEEVLVTPPSQGPDVVFQADLSRFRTAAQIRFRLLRLRLRL